MAVETYNAVGEKLTDNARILREAVLAALGTSVRVAPFNDELLRKVGVWLQGDSLEMEEVVRQLSGLLQAAKVGAVIMPWRASAERG